MESYFDVLNSPLTQITPPPPSYAPPEITSSGDFTPPPAVQEKSPMPLAMAYVTMQPMNSEMYGDEMALESGTLFPDLDMPFKGGAR